MIDTEFCTIVKKGDGYNILFGKNVRYCKTIAEALLLTSSINKIYLGDNRQTIASFADDSIDTFISDWPYGLNDKNRDLRDIMRTMDRGETYYGGNGFMGNKWDSFIPGPDFTSLHLQKQKPGGYYLAFCSPRNVHIAMTSLEYGGYNIITTIVWLYGSDFNKSRGRTKELTEFIVLAQKPIEQGLTTKENVAKWGTGELNIEGGRLNGNGQTPIRGYTGKSKIFSMNVDTLEDAYERNSGKGRVPSNVILSHAVGCKLLGVKQVKSPSSGVGAGKKRSRKTSFGLNDIRPEYTRVGDENGKETVENWQCVDGCPVKNVGISGGGVRKNGGGNGKREQSNHNSSAFHKTGTHDVTDGIPPDVGTVARYYYNSKSSSKERHAGCYQLYWAIDSTSQVGYRKISKTEWASLPSDQRRRGNIHPTVKPVDLGRYLAVLTANSDGGGIVCDPFCGSGSLLIGAMYAGRPFIGCELNAEYVDIAGTRVDYALRLLKRGKFINDIKVQVCEQGENGRPKQLGLFAEMRQGELF